MKIVFLVCVALAYTTAYPVSEGEVKPGVPLVSADYSTVQNAADVKVEPTKVTEEKPEVKKEVVDALKTEEVKPEAAKADPKVDAVKEEPKKEAVAEAKSEVLAPVETKKDEVKAEQVEGPKVEEPVPVVEKKEEEKVKSELPETTEAAAVPAETPATVTAVNEVKEEGSSADNMVAMAPVAESGPEAPSAPLADAPAEATTTLPVTAAAPSSGADKVPSVESESVAEKKPDEIRTVRDTEKEAVKPEEKKDAVKPEEPKDIVKAEEPKEAAKTEEKVTEVKEENKGQVKPEEKKPEEAKKEESSEESKEDKKVADQPKSSEESDESKSSEDLPKKPIIAPLVENKEEKAQDSTKAEPDSSMTKPEAPIKTTFLEDIFVKKPSEPVPQPQKS